MKRGLGLKRCGSTRIVKQRAAFDLALKNLGQEIKRYEDRLGFEGAIEKREATRQPQVYESQLGQQGRAPYCTLTLDRADHGALA